MAHIANLSEFTIDQLAEQYLAPQKMWVRSNMAISIDGHFADDNQTSQSFSSELDLRILLLLRALSDVVVVGGRTARQENYFPKFPRQEFAHLNPTGPRLCVVTQSVNFDPADALFQQNHSRPIVIVPASDDLDIRSRVDALRDVSDVVVLPEVTGTALVTALRSMELNSIVSEGGPFLQQLLRQDGVLNELDVTIAPVIHGAASIELPFGSARDACELMALGTANSFLFARYLISS